MALNNHYATALGPRLGLGLRLDFGSQVWFVQYFSEKKVIVLYASQSFFDHPLLPHIQRLLRRRDLISRKGKVPS